MTRQRKTIYEVVQSSDAHLTAEEIFLRAKEKLPTLSIATVYRNLGLMVRDGEIRRVTARGADRFDRNIKEHDHLICARCSQMSDVVVEKLKAELEQLTGRQILYHDLNMYYICPDCAARTAEHFSGKR